jgi:crotonobetainyl-CoA:carnitine CoA-transferase CaiB-like acyl-CoA transferase
MKQPLSGIKVLDLTHVLAGPFSTYQLGQMGAEVIRIEAPGDPDMLRDKGHTTRFRRARMGLSYAAVNGNKKSLTLNLRSSAGVEICKKLVTTADVFVENFRPGAIASLGLGYESLKAINSRLIYCSITGYGQKGPMSHRTSYDPVVQAACGMMHRNGKRVPSPVVDYSAGLNAAFAVTAALLQRSHSGQGQYIDCSMLDTALQLMGPPVTEDLCAGPKRVGGEALTESYATKDGREFQWGCFNLRQHRRFWTAVERPEFSELSTWDAIWDTYATQCSTVKELMLERTAEEWDGFSSKIGVPGCTVLTLSEACRQPQVVNRGFTQPVEIEIGGHAETVEISTTGFTFLEGGPKVTAPPPQLGEHTKEILEDLGYSSAEITKFRAEGIV